MTFNVLDRHYKPKTAFVNEESRLRSEMSVDPAVSKINLRPFTSAQDQTWRTRSVDVKKDKEDFMTKTLKKQRPLRPYETTVHRVKWSREVQMPPLDIVNNKSNSTALVGGALSYTKTSHWCSSSSSNYGNLLLSATGEENEAYILPGSTGVIIAKQLHEGTGVRICTNKSYKRAKNIPQNAANEDLVCVPLCFDDELKRKSAKVLTARPPTVCQTLPIVGETYPLINSTDSEPFTSPAFNCVNLPEPLIHYPSVLKTKTHSTLIRPTDVMRQSQRAEGGAIGARTVHVLTADGHLTKRFIDGPLFLSGYDVKPSSGVFTNTSAGPRVSLSVSRQRSIKKTHVGAMVNGINPKHDAKKSPSDNLKTAFKMSRGKLVYSGHVTTPQPQRNAARQNEVNFMLISKPLQTNHSLDLVAKQQLNKDLWPRETAVSDNYGTSQVTDDENMGLGEINVSASRPRSVDHTSRDGSPGMRTEEVLHCLNGTDESNTSSETVGSLNDTETPQPIPQVQRSHAINIPTAESYD